MTETMTDALAEALRAGRESTLYSVRKHVRPGPGGYHVDVPTHVVVECVGQRGVPRPDGPHYGIQVGGPDPRAVDIAARFGRPLLVYGDRPRPGAYVMTIGRFARFRAALDAAPTAA